MGSRCWCEAGERSHIDDYGSRYQQTTHLFDDGILSQLDQVGLVVSVHHIRATSVVRVVHVAEVCRGGHGATGLRLQAPGAGAWIMRCEEQPWSWLWRRGERVTR